MINLNELGRKISIMAPVCAYYKALLVKTSQTEAGDGKDSCLVSVCPSAKAVKSS